MGYYSVDFQGYGILLILLPGIWKTIYLTSRDMGDFTPIFRVRTHYLSSDKSSDLSMKNININITSHNENVNEDMNDNN